MMVPSKGKESMTATKQSLWRKVILRGIGAVFLGTVTVIAFVSLLCLYGVTPETSRTLNAHVLKFPANEQAMDDMTAQLAREGAALSKVEPAAGDKK
jgi:hypothetical protein